MVVKVKIVKVMALTIVAMKFCSESDDCQEGFPSLLLSIIRYSKSKTI
jgi:hypothetical protein